jgi:hypothetical protein
MCVFGVDTFALPYTNFWQTPFFQDFRLHLLARVVEFDSGNW